MVQSMKSEWPIVIPDIMHKISHRLTKIYSKHGVYMVFTAPFTLPVPGHKIDNGNQKI